MKTLQSYLIGFALLTGASACNTNTTQNIASGSFEADEILISAEVGGKIKELNIDEGSLIQSGQIFGLIDTTSLFIKKEQIRAKIKAIEGRWVDIPVQTKAIVNELDYAKSEQIRVSNLVLSNAAPTQLLDDINSKVTVLESKLSSTKATLSTANLSFLNEVEVLRTQLMEVEDQLQKCNLSSPINGVVLKTYAHAYELTMPGKPLFSVADLNSLKLKAYITADQLSNIALNQEVTVRIDGENGFENYTGEITWISSESEFTPKTIQTQNERANKVYAIEALVENDGRLKIGMYGEIVF